MSQTRKVIVTKFYSKCDQFHFKVVTLEEILSFYSLLSTFFFDIKEI